MHEDPRLESLLTYLSISTKNQPYLMKDESSGQLMNQIITSSPKQYIVTSRGEEDWNSFPIMSSSPHILTKKVKGLYRDIKTIRKNDARSGVRTHVDVFIHWSLNPTP